MIYMIDEALTRIDEFKSILSGREGSKASFAGYIRLTFAIASVIAFWLFFAFSPSEEHFFARHFFTFTGPKLDPYERPEILPYLKLTYAIEYAFTLLWIVIYVVGSVTQESIIKAYGYAWLILVTYLFVIGGTIGIVVGIFSLLGGIWKISDGSVGEFFVIIGVIVGGLAFIGLFFAGGGGKALDSLSRNSRRYR